MHRFVSLWILLTLFAAPASAQTDATLNPPGDIASDPVAEQTAVPPDDVEPSAASSTNAASPTKKASPIRVIRIAVMDFDNDGIDEGVARIVEQSVVLELRKMRRTDVIGMDEVRQIISFEEQKAALGCDEASCLAELGDALGADIVVVGTLAKVGESHVFGLRAISPENVTLVGAVSRRLTPAGGEEYLAAIGPVVEELLPTLVPKDGATRGVPDEVALRLNPPPLPVWPTVTTAGVAAGLAVLAVAALAVNIGGGALYSNMVNDAKTGAPTTYNTLLGLGWTTNGAMIVAAAAGLGAGLALVAAVTMAFFTDWDGVGDDDGE